MNESPAARRSASVTDECRRLAELLDLDAVGVSITVRGERRVAGWTTPGAPSFPQDIDAVLAGRESGWIAAELETGSAVFGRVGPRTSSHASSILAAVGPQIATAWSEEEIVADAVQTAAAVEAAAPERWDHDTTAVQRVITAGRRVLENPESTGNDLLFSLREALFADEVFHIIDRDGDVQVLSSPPSERNRRIPKEIRSTVAALSPPHPVEEATARQLAVVLGARTPFVGAAFCRDDRPTELLLVGWRESSAVSPTAMKLIALLTASNRAAIDSRLQAVEQLLVRERQRWAYEIHDGVTQAVTTSVLELEALHHKIERDPREAIETLSVTKAEIRKALSELRGILFDLSKDKTPSIEQGEPLTKYVQDVVRRWRLPARVTVKGDLFHVPKQLLGAAYVVIREALANAAKHSAASNVSVWISASADELLVEVEDTGRGFTPTLTAGPEGRHFGLGMMKRRVAEIGGTIEIDSRPGRGTRVVATLPIQSRSGG